MSEGRSSPGGGWGVSPLVGLLIGCVACATSVLWIKFSKIEPVLLTGLRLAIAAVLLAPLAARDWRRRRDELDWSHLRDTAIPGLILVAHFVTWIYGVRLTLAGNGTLIVNLTPLATPFLLAVLSSERVTPREIGATALALGGLAILFAADFHVSHETLLGDAVCFGSMLLVALYLTLAKRFRHHPTTLLYVTPLYAIAGATALALSVFTQGSTPLDWRREAVWVLLLALLPTVVGHSLINRAMREMRGQLVSVVNMSQFVFAALGAWALLGERPGVAFYPAAALVLAAGWLVADRGHRSERAAAAVNRS